MKISLPLLILLALVEFAVSPGYSQNPAIFSHPDTANYPYWITMMQDPDARFHATQSAFQKYWAGRTDYSHNGWKVFKRWEYINEPRVQPDGKLPTASYMMQQYYNYTQTHQRQSPSGSWTPIGPVSYPVNATGQPTGMGRLNVIAFHPTDANTLFVGSPSGGFWKTPNGGLTWTNLTSNLPFLGVSAILIHPTNPNIIYLGTGDRDAADAPGIGVYKSTDGGISFNASNTGMGNFTVGMMLMHPSDPNTILAATSNGIYKSTDGGASWTIKSSNSNYKDIKFKPGDPTIVYATENGNFYRSSDTGETWTQITNNILPGARMVIGVSLNQPGYVYLLQTNYPTPAFVGLMRSTDSGLTFATRSTTPNIMDLNCDGSGTYNQSFYDICIAVDPNNANIIYTGGVSVWKNSNGGATGFWIPVSNWIGQTWGTMCAPTVHADIHALSWSPLNGSNKLYACCDGGLYLTSNGGTAWTELSSGLAIAQVYKIGQSATSEPLVINGYQDNGTATNNGTSFTTVIGGDGMECMIDYTDTNYRYGEVYYGKIYRTTGYGYFPIAGNTVNGINESGGWVTPYILHATNPNSMFVGFINVWRSTNVKNGDPTTVTWTAISTGESYSCSVLKQSLANVDILYVARPNSLKRTDNANAVSVSWTACTVPGGAMITDLATHPTDPNIVYATTAFKVYKSSDKGATWADITGNLPGVSFNCLVYDKNSNEGIYVGNWTGIYYKDATMSDWVAFNTGLPLVSVRKLEIYYGTSWFTSKIKAATYGRGLWQSDLIETGVVNPTSFTAAPVSMSEIDLSWVKNASNNNVMLAYNTTATFGTPVNGNTYLQGQGIPGGGTVIYNGSATSFNHTSLTPSTLYYYKLWSYNGSTQYSFGATASATTLICNLITTYPWIEGFENAGNIPACWIQEYVSLTKSWVFQNGGSTGGSNPSTAHTGSYNATFYIANFTHPITKLVSPPLNLTLITNPILRFWHTQAVFHGQDELRVYYRTTPTGTWILLATYTNNIVTWTQESIQLPNPSLTYYIAFEGKANWGYGVCLDDVAVTTNALTWNGTGNWTTYSDWTPPYVPTVFDNASINSGTCTVNTNVTCSAINVNTGANLSISPSKAMTVSGNVTIIQ